MVVLNLFYKNIIPDQFGEKMTRIVENSIQWVGLRHYSLVAP